MARGYGGDTVGNQFQKSEVETKMVGPHYLLRMFLGEKEVGVSTAAIAPDAQSYPVVGQIIDGKWRITEVLDSPEGEYRVRVAAI